MRALVFCCLLLAAVPWTASAQRDKPTGPPKKGDVILVRGCLAGGALEAIDLGSDDTSAFLPDDVTFRLTGDKKVLKQMRDEADGKVVHVEGRLKSDLPQENGHTRKLGKVRIRIGTPDAAPGSLEAEGRRSLPVLEVKSFERSSTTCGR